MKSYVKQSYVKVTKKHKSIMNYNSIRQQVLDKGYIFFEEGDYNLNIIFERTSNKITNYFTDKLHILYKVNNQPIILSVDCTTKPGIKGSIDSPIKYDGIIGTAIIVPGQYRGAYRFVEGYKDKHYPFNVPYFEQIKPINYWRDGDKDLNIDTIDDSDKDKYIVTRQDTKIFGTHIHNMSNPGKRNFPVNNWSKGCMGYEEPTFHIIEPVIREAIKRWGRVFTVTLIESNK